MIPESGWIPLDPDELEQFWQRQADAILACGTEKQRLVAIRDLLLSNVELGPHVRELIAGYFVQGRPRESAGSGFDAVLLFVRSGYAELRGRPRDKAIRKCCEAVGCTRRQFREQVDLINVFKRYGIPAD